LLECDYFPENYFELWDIYDKYASVQGVKSAERLHKEKDELGRSAHAVKTLGKLHDEKNEEGKSVAALEMNEKLHEEKDELGRSVTAMKTNTQQWQNTHPDWPPHITNSGALSRWQKARGIPTEFRVRLPEVCTVHS
jgi:hypothetical protein